MERSIKIKVEKQQFIAVPGLIKLLAEMFVKEKADTAMSTKQK